MRKIWFYSIIEIDLFMLHICKH